jgi:hypothetical protein
MVMLVFAVHLVVNNKFAGHAAAIGTAGADGTPGFLRVTISIPSFIPELPLEQIVGTFWRTAFWFNLYWTSDLLGLVL